MAIWKVVSKTSTAFVWSDRIKQSDGVFLFLQHLTFVFFLPNKAWSHREVHSLSADTFPVKLKVMSQFLFVLPGTWCLWRAPAQLLAMSRFHPPPNGLKVGWLVCFSWCTNAMTPSSFIPEAASWRGAWFPVLFSQQLSLNQQAKKFVSGFVIREKSLLRTLLRHWNSLCTSHQGTVF